MDVPLSRTNACGWGHGSRTALRIMVADLESEPNATRLITFDAVVVLLV